MRFFAAAIIAANLTALLASVFGGVAIAGERGERSADFMAMLPASRKQIIISKWAVSFLVVGAFGAFNGMIALLLLFPHWNYSDSAAAIALWIGCAISLFGVAWSLSTFTRSGPISACASIGVTVIMLVSVGLTLNGHWHSKLNPAFVFAAGTLILGTGSMILGGFYYLRRISP